MNDELPEPTPEYELKPKLVFIGRLFGMDVYIDIRGKRNPQQKHKLATDWLKWAARQGE